MKKIFIHIPKNGGSSIAKSKELQGIAVQPNVQHLDRIYKQKVTKWANGIGRSPAYGHCRWKDLDEKYRTQHQAFTIVRNPWSWIVSQFMFGQKLYSEGHTKFAYYTNNDSFDHFIELIPKIKNEPYNWHRTTANFQNQKDYVIDDKGKLKCDILRLEYHNEDVMKYFNLNNPLPRKNVSNVNKRDYKEFYNETTKQLVAEHFKDDIDFFGFTFDGPATKNIWNTN